MRLGDLANHDVVISQFDDRVYLAFDRADPRASYAAQLDRPWIPQRSSWNVTI